MYTKAGCILKSLWCFPNQGPGLIPTQPGRIGLGTFNTESWRHEFYESEHLKFTQETVIPN